MLQRLTTINFSLPRGPAQWEVPAPDEKAHGPRPLAFTLHAHVGSLQRWGLYHALADPVAGSGEDIRASNYLAVKHVEGLRVHAACNLRRWVAARHASDPTTDGPWQLTLPCMESYPSCPSMSALGL
jgi:hypothetical protein